MSAEDPEWARTVQGVWSAILPGCIGVGVLGPPTPVAVMAYRQAELRSRDVTADVSQVNRRNAASAAARVAGSSLWLRPRNDSSHRRKAM